MCNTVATNTPCKDLIASWQADSRIIKPNGSVEIMAFIWWFTWYLKTIINQSVCMLVSGDLVLYTVDCCHCLECLKEIHIA